MGIENFIKDALNKPNDYVAYPKHGKEERPRPRTPASVNRDLACLSKVLSMTQTKLGKVMRFERKKRDRSTKQIAPSSRHLEVEQFSDQQHEDVSVRQLAS